MITKHHGLPGHLETKAKGLLREILGIYKRAGGNEALVRASFD